MTTAITRLAKEVLERKESDFAYNSMHEACKLAKIVLEMEKYWFEHGCEKSAYDCLLCKLHHRCQQIASEGRDG